VLEVSTKSKAKGTAAEREVVNYLQQWWPTAERRALSGNKDKGDVAGIPGVVVEVKAAVTQQLAAWKRETLVEMENASAKHCVLVVKRAYKPVQEWDAYLPWMVLQPNPEGVKEWVRMDLKLAVSFLLCPSRLSSPTTASS
jgi:Holliday junction resolvase